MRLYEKATELKAAGRDWRGWLLRQWTGGDTGLALVAQIMRDDDLKTSTQRVAAFAERGGGSRAKYMRLQAQLRKLTGTPDRSSETLRPAPAPVNPPHSDGDNTDVSPATSGEREATDIAGGLSDAA